jgi:hypothetical protein
MKHRIFYSKGEQLYKIESKRTFGKWELRENYLYTDDSGNFISAKGFYSYDNAEEWISDRYPDLNISKHKNNNIGFEF